MQSNAPHNKTRQCKATKQTKARQYNANRNKQKRSNSKPYDAKEGRDKETHAMLCTSNGRTNKQHKATPSKQLRYINIQTRIYLHVLMCWNVCVCFSWWVGGWQQCTGQSEPLRGAHSNRVPLWATWQREPARGTHSNNVALEPKCGQSSWVEFGRRTLLELGGVELGGSPRE